MEDPWFWPTLSMDGVDPQARGRAVRSVTRREGDLPSLVRLPLPTWPARTPVAGSRRRDVGGGCTAWPPPARSWARSGTTPRDREFPTPTARNATGAPAALSETADAAGVITSRRPLAPFPALGCRDSRRAVMPPAVPARTTNATSTHWTLGPDAAEGAECGATTAESSTVRGTPTEVTANPTTSTVYPTAVVDALCTSRPSGPPKRPPPRSSPMRAGRESRRPSFRGSLSQHRPAGSPEEASMTVPWTTPLGGSSWRS